MKLERGGIISDHTIPTLDLRSYVRTHTEEKSFGNQLHFFVC
jgi:hypothetical protein